jgi:hypothetical protein
LCGLEEKPNLGLGEKIALCIGLERSLTELPGDEAA